MPTPAAQTETKRTGTPPQSRGPGKRPDLPKLAAAGWMYHADTVADTSFWAVAKRLPTILRDALSLAWRANRRDAAAAIGLNFAAGAFTTLGLLATSGVLRELFAGGPSADRIRAALPALITALVAVSLRGGLLIAAGWAQARMMPQINYQIEVRLFEATTGVEMAAFDDAGFSEDMDRARNRGLMEGAAIVDTSVNLLTGLVGVIATAAAVTVIEPILLPALLLAAIPSAVTAIRMARREYQHMLRRFHRRRLLWVLGQVMGNRASAAEVRTYQMRGFLLGQYRGIMGGETTEQLKLVRQQTGTRLIGASIAGLATFALYAILMALLDSDLIPLAAAATALIALQQARTSLNMSIHAANSLYEDALYYDDFLQFLARAEARRIPTGGRPVTDFDEITLTDVRLQYPGTDKLALDGVTLTVRRGQTIALVGENGSGKSTLAKVIAGLYTPTSGSICWDGVDVRDLDPAARAAHVAVVTQDWEKFPFTAGQNISVGRHDRSADTPGPTVQEAATAASAHDLIMGLPDGYDTFLDRAFQGGQDLSGGQWQRLVLARALYRNAGLLICDEPSSALDPRAEHAIFEQLLDRSGRTTCLITHRLANVRRADMIYVLDKGKVVEQGTHEHLMTTSGLYRQLYQMQAAGYTDELGAS